MTCSGFLDSATANRAYKKHYIWHFSQSTLYIGKNISREIVFRGFSERIWLFCALCMNSALSRRLQPHTVGIDTHFSCNISNFGKLFVFWHFLGVIKIGYFFQIWLINNGFACGSSKAANAMGTFFRANFI